MAKKKYYQSKKDRRDESRGMKRYEEDRRMEKNAMIHEDRNAPANLPQGVVHRYYPDNKDYRMYNLNDTIEGIDVQMYDDSKKGKKGKYPQKY